MRKYGMRRDKRRERKEGIFFTVGTANNKCYVYPAVFIELMLWK